MNKYTYDVKDVYNCFGAGHNYRLTLYKGLNVVNYWDYDSILGIGSILVQRKIRKLEKIYGARRL